MKKINKKSLYLVVFLGSLLFVPDLSREVLIDQMSFTFLQNFSSTGFYLMLSVLSCIWAYLSFLYDVDEFKARKLIARILIIPLLILSITILALLLVRPLGFLGNYLTSLYKIIDIFVLSIFLVLLYRKFNDFFSRKPLQVKKLRINVIYNLCIAVLFAFLAFPKLNTCRTFDCRNAELRTALGKEVYQVVESYIKSSPLIISNIGQVKNIANTDNGHVKTVVWLDYSAEMNIEVLGENGTGILDLTIAGNDFKSLEHYQGEWSFNGVKTLIGVDGKIDEARTKYNLLKQRETLLESTNDCSILIPLIEKNELESKAGKAYDFDHIKTTKIIAECYEKAGQLDKASEKYALYSFYIRPYPFQEKETDLPKIEESKAIMQKAMKLNPNYKYLNIWQLELEGLEIQAQLARNSCDEELRNKLKSNFASRKVNYKTLPACIKK